MRHLIDIRDFSIREIDELLTLAIDIIDHREKYAHVCDGKKLATLFYEPSTRTRLSFTSAMMELGGQVLGFSDARSSSVSKGETVADTVRVVGCFADIIAMRHYKEGAPQVASEFSPVPIINAGDGGHFHPTQTLTDLLSIRRELGRIDHLTIGLCGDLKYGRTVHSLIQAMERYEGIHFVLISPKELQLPDYMKHEVAGRYTEVETLEDAMPLVDVLYMTRVQQERFADQDEYMRLRDSFILDTEKMALAKEKMIVLHPLPRVNEITPAVDNDPRAAYFRQVENGKHVRKALIYTLLRWTQESGAKSQDLQPTSLSCSNPVCISLVEPVDKMAYTDKDGILRCHYCDHKL